MFEEGHGNGELTLMVYKQRKKYNLKHACVSALFLIVGLFDGSYNEQHYLEQLARDSGRSIQRVRRRRSKEEKAVNSLFECDLRDLGRVMLPPSGSLFPFSSL